jgi:hypothetical protein
MVALEVASSISCRLNLALCILSLLSFANPRFAPERPMYHDIPMIILLLATGYLFTVYLLLILAQRSSKVPR